MLPKYYEFYCPVHILSGRAAIANLPYELNQRNVENPLVITDKGVVEAGLLEKVKAAFNDSEMTLSHIFGETPPDSSNRIVNEVAKLYQEKGCDGIVAVGGGSVLDTAKGVNIVISEKTDDLLKFQGVDRVSAKMQPMFSVATTAGTGSEVTSAAVIYNEEVGQKMAFMSNKIYPDVAVVDPALMETMPPRITAATGMDALTHAVEAYTGLQKNPISDAFARSAIELIGKHLVDAVEDGKNKTARLAMANAALLAGIAFSNSMVGLVHALAHATGGVAHVPHGVANSIYLPHVMAYNIEKAAEPLADIALMLGEKPTSGKARQAQSAVLAVEAIASRLHLLCGHPVTLRQAGVVENQMEAIAKLAIDDGSLTYNPEEADFEDALALVKKAY